MSNLKLDIIPSPLPPELLESEELLELEELLDGGGGGGGGVQIHLQVRFPHPEHIWCTIFALQLGHFSSESLDDELLEELELEELELDD